MSFGTTKLNSEEGQAELKVIWKGMLEAIEKGLSPSTPVPLSKSVLNAAASAFSFGLNEKSLPADETLLLHRFVAYLKIVLEELVFQKYIPSDLAEESASADG